MKWRHWRKCAQRRLPLEALNDIETTARLLGVEVDELRGGLNLIQAAGLLGIGVSTLRQRALDGEIGYQRDGRRWLFYWWHLAAYLNMRESVMTRGKEVKEVFHSTTRGDNNVLEDAKSMGLL